jgi:two-component system, LytTR family, sensor kinase
MADDQAGDELPLRQPPPSSRLTPARIWLLAFGFWTVFGVLNAVQVYLRESTRPGGASPHSVFNIVYFYWAWAVLTPGILWLARTLPGPRATPWRQLRWHLPAAVCAGAVQAALYTGFSALDGQVPSSALGTVVRQNAMRHFAGALLTYCSIVVFYHALAFHQGARERELASSRATLKAAELEALLVRARLGALRMQLNPHFVFNTLNTVSALVAKGDAAIATRVIARLGDMLRVGLSVADVQEMTLAHELAFTRHYVAIEQLRYGGRLIVTEDVDHAALGCYVPTLILQPLVENAIKHGMVRVVGSTRVEIAAALKADALTVSVRDDGPGFEAAGGASRSGTGLANARTRLALLYGAQARLITTNAPDGGAVVVLQLPVRSHPADGSVERQLGPDGVAI